MVGVRGEKCPGTRKRTSGSQQYGFCGTCHTLGQFISSGQHAAQNDHTFVFQAPTADEEERGGGSKGEETERMDDSRFMTAASRTNTAAHVRSSLQGRVINTPLENT